MASHRKSGSGDAPQEDTHDRATPAAASSAEFCGMPELFLPGQSGASLADRGQHPAEHGETSGPQLYTMPPIQGPSSNILPSLSYQMESSKKPRTQFTPKQLCHLEEIFEKNRFPNAKERAAIAKELELTLNHIQIWFQNRRAKYRRKKKKHKVEEELSKVPRPPSFWPASLPFDSNIAQTQLQEVEVDSDEKSKKTRSSSQDRSHSPEVPTTLTVSSTSSRPGSSKKTSRSQKEAKSPLQSSSLDSIPPSRSIEQPSALPVEGPYTREMSQLQSLLESPSSVMSPPIFAEDPVLLYDILEDIPDFLMSPLHEGYMPGMAPQVYPGPSMQHQHNRPPVPTYPQHHFTPPPHYYNPAFDISYLPSSSFLPQTTISQQPLPPNQPPFSETCTPPFSSGDRFPPQMPLSTTSPYHYEHLTPQYREAAASQARHYQPPPSSHVKPTNLPKTTRALE